MQLSRIEHVATPQIGQGAGTDEIDGTLPAAQQVGIGIKSGEGFT